MAVSPLRPSVAVGPEVPGWGSWDWVGQSFLDGLSGPFVTRTFRPWDIPDAHAVGVVKHAPPPEWAEEVGRRAALVYCPIDFYDSAAAIEADAGWLALCATVAVHCHRLVPHFAAYTRTTYLDHPIRYAATLRRAHQQ